MAPLADRPSRLRRGAEGWSLLGAVFQKLIWLLPAGMLANLTYTFLRTDHTRLGDVLEISPGFLLLAVVLVLLPWFFNAWRLWRWLRFLRHPLSFARVVRMVLVCELGAAISPSAMGGGGFKAALLMQQGLRSGTALGLMMVGTFESALFPLIVIPSAWFVLDLAEASWMSVLLRTLTERGGSVAAAFAILLGILLALDRFGRRFSILRIIHERVRRTLADAKHVTDLTRGEGKWLFAGNVLLAVFQWSARFLVAGVLFLGLGMEINLLHAAVLQWCCLTAMNFIPTPGATGGAEVMFLLIYDGWLPQEGIALAMSAWRFLSFYFLSLTAALIVWLVRPRRTRVGDREPGKRSCPPLSMAYARMPDRRSVRTWFR